MEGKWTKGPWHVEQKMHTCGEHKLTCIDIVADPEGLYRGRVCSAQSAEHIDGMTGEEVQANARLIAQAPAMAEALHRLVTEAELDGTEAKAGWDCWIAEARALLTAIKGE